MRATRVGIRVSLAFAVLLSLVLPAVWPGAAVAAGGGWRYFPETGCWVGNDFLDYFDAHGGLDIFGFPIENATVESNVGVQYFQRARMELRPEQSAAYRIQLGLLGQQIYGRIDPPVPADQRPAATDRANRYFPETGQVVSFAFLDYFNSHGGVDIFGYPISGQFTEKGVTVQYFQRARMEWHPENAEKYRVQLGLVGLEVFSRRGQVQPTPFPTIPPAQPAGVTPQPTKPAATAAPAPGKAVTTTTPQQPSPSAVAGQPVPAQTPAAQPAAASASLLTVSQVIMFVVTFLVVVLVGLVLLWKRGAIQEWLVRRRGGPRGGAGA
jgi:hypothetical protein